MNEKAVEIYNLMKTVATLHYFPSPLSLSLCLGVFVFAFNCVWAYLFLFFL